MKFSNWTPQALEKWAALLPSSPLMNPHNKIKIWGEIHVDNSEPITIEGDTYGETEKEESSRP